MLRASIVTTAPVARGATIAVAALALLARARAQNYDVAFSADWRSNIVGAADTQYGAPITEGDILWPTAPARVPAFGPLLPPSAMIKAGAPGFGAPHLGLAGHVPCVGHPGGTPCVVEVDALDLGTAQRLSATQPLLNRLYFSVDRYAIGIGAPAAPGIATEAPIADLAADVLVDLGVGTLPAPPFTALNVGSVAVIDGSGTPSWSGAVYRGVGLLEGIAGTIEDNLDALAFASVNSPAGYFPPGGVFFSLDASFVDPATGLANTGSAAFHGFVGGDVLRTALPGGAPVVYAAASLLGLDVFGADSDDLDALVLAENGLPGFQVSKTPFDWNTSSRDMLLFSVRRGSAVIGQPDSLFGLPIEPGDVLTTPLPAAFGGLSPFPAIFIAAENLGLRTAGGIRGGGGALVGDDLDALELATVALNDCNGNGREDSVDIALGSSSDANGNGIPDECERSYTHFCFCAPPLGPCGNSFASAGCRNSTGAGALMTPSGSTSEFADNLLLTTTGLPPFVNTLTFMSANLAPPAPFFDGRKCLVGPLMRFGVANSGQSGSVTRGPGLSAYSFANFTPSNWIQSGATFGFQTWYRDPSGPCAKFSNLSSAVKATFTP